MLALLGFAAASSWIVVFLAGVAVRWAVVNMFPS